MRDCDQELLAHRRQMIGSRDQLEVGWQLFPLGTELD